MDALSSSDTMDSVLLLTRASVYVAVYDESFEKLVDVRIAALDDIVRMELAPTSRNPRLHFRLWTRAGDVFISGKTVSEDIACIHS